MIKLLLTVAVLSIGGCNEDLAFSSGMLHPQKVSAFQHDARVAHRKYQLVEAVIGEAEGEPQQGKEAVACAINNRGKTLRGVYGLNAPRVRKHLYSRQTYDNALVAVWMAEDREYCTGLIHGAQFWEGTRFPIPYWAKSMQLTAVIGNQRFFRKD